MATDGLRMSREDLLKKSGDARAGTRRLVNAGRYQAAREQLTRMIGQLRAELADRDDDLGQNEVAEALADTYGMLGGVERRAGNSAAAAAAYGAGREIEQSDRYGIVDSYNLTNSLVLEILLDPRGFPARADELVAARTQVRRQVDGSRARQWWAWADYGLLCLLTGEVQEAGEAYDQFAVSGPDRSGYDSVIGVLTELATALESVGPACAQAITTQVGILGRRRP